MTPDRRVKEKLYPPWGQVLQVVVILLGMWAATIRIENRIATLEAKVDPVWRWFTTITRPPTMITTQP